MTVIQGFLICRQWHDTPEGFVLRYWLHTDNGPLLIEQHGQQGIFFVETDKADKARAILGSKVSQTKPLKLISFNHKEVEGFYFSNQQRLRQSAKLLKDQNIDPFEEDVRTIDRYLMERFITAPMSIEVSEIEDRNHYRYARNARLQTSDYQPQFRVISFDIETAIVGNHLFSIAVYGKDIGHVFMVGEGQVEKCSFYPNERALLKAFLSWMNDYNPDILIGWNCINFDLRFLEHACKKNNLRFELGRNREEVEWRQHPENENHHFVIVPGRAVIDGIDMLKMATYTFESFSLESVGRELLGKGKLIHDPDDRGEEITRLFNEDKGALAKYNLEDCALVWEIFEKTDLIKFSIERARMTGLPIDKIGGSVAAFENQYLPRLHRQGYVAPNLPINPQGVGSPGGYVMSSRPGLYDNVLVLDFKSLYPSIIRSFLIDPYGLTEGDRYFGETKPTDNYAKDKFSKGFRGAFFKKSDSILPGLIASLWQDRDKAKASQNAPLSQAIKIIMNSFYGVMGTPGCRFFDARLPSSITLRGHEIMNQTRELIEQQGYEVIYGDTDSIFVWLNREATEDEANKIGFHLALSVNQWWKKHLDECYQLHSALELEFESHYTRFLMPTIRGSKEGTKKRYAGMVGDSNDYKLIFKGLETVRTDWTMIAREFQRKLYELIFLGHEYEPYIKQVVEEIKQGKHDDKLIYRKRLRRKLNEYERNIPPHVQAALKADNWLVSQNRKPRYQNGGWVEYAYTINGPEPRECLFSQLDYDLYLERQIAPIVDGIVSFLGNSYHNITNQQLNLI